MERNVVERRKHPRVPSEQACWRAVRLRTGDPLVLVNLAPGGALVESTRRLLPGTTVILQVNLDEGTLSVRAEVKRCAVHLLRSDQVQYRGALAFEEEHVLAMGARALNACA
ncbi:MAG: PilZ domain-containing protein [Acidobacteriota bacterium]